MVKPRLKRYDRKQLLTNQLQLTPNFGESRIDAFRRLVPTTPINSETQSDLHTFVAPLEQVAQSAAAACDISRGARVPEQVGINLKLKFEF
uniref:Ribosomal protein S16 n=1 Tax=Leptochilus decurrens TaxID=194891 RepID=A0A8K1M3X8_9MONI|nr:ribosomal protein S16 [Leptochilus decurrens]UBI43125.1 ribosomal protein S16 [Leptochilus decurrens]